MFKRRKPDDQTPTEPTRPDPADLNDTPAGRADSGLGVPAFRPTLTKDMSAMARPPLPLPTPFPPPGAGTAAATAVARSGLPPARMPQREPTERRTLVVGHGISVQGTVQDAERLVVEGTVEATLLRATELSVAPGGMFKGEVEVDDAEIAGTIDGTLTANASLIVRATGRVMGTARCRRLQVEDGGQITGRIEMLSEPTAGAAPARDAG